MKSNSDDVITDDTFMHNMNEDSLAPIDITMK